MISKHDLHSEFPEFDQKIHDLKISNSHFKILFDEYHDVNNIIHRIESGAENVSDDVLNNYRSKRVYFKDALYSILKKNGNVLKSV